ncbi:MAG TPA: septal ring lytic transglycosylase RlpA family protein [Candidatus Limnocylindrales bacterium]|jgi:hypothetical protein
MRLPRVVAGLALIVGLALVVLPGPVGSRTPTLIPPLDPARFEVLALQSRPRTTATATLDPAHRSDGALDPAAVLLEPVGVVVSATTVVLPPVRRGVIVVVPWHYDPEVSWYGPGFYGRRTACGLAYTTTLMGVAHRSLPCGTRVRFRNPRNGQMVTVPVIDRGPYVAGRTWDLSGATCKALDHCYTGPIEWRFP